MKKTVLGVGLLLFAGWVVLQGSFGIPFIEISLWPLLFVLFLVYQAIKRLVEKRFKAGLSWALVAFIVANANYDLLPISAGTILFAGVLAILGVQLIFSDSRRFRFVRHTKMEEINDEGLSWSLAFGTASRFICSDDFSFGRAEVDFGTANIYFDKATILGDSARYHVEVSFGQANLYVPREWEVISSVDNSFSGISMTENYEIKTKKLYLTGDVSFGHLKIIYL